MELKNNKFLSNLQEKFGVIDISRYAYVWIIMSKNAFMGYLNQKRILAIFLAGKVLRFIFFMTFLYFLVAGSGGLAGYNSTQIIFFFLTFSLIDTIAQFLFREVYRFRQLVVSGDLDLILSKPINPLFRVLMGGADVIDLITLPPLVVVLVLFMVRLDPSLFNVLSYLVLIINGLLISAAFHILVLSFGIMTLEVDHTVMIFRDLSRLGTIPIDVFRSPFREFITYFLPIGIMLSFPSKALMGSLSPTVIFLSICFGLLAFWGSIRFWSYALKKYSSASS